MFHQENEVCVENLSSSKTCSVRSVFECAVFALENLFVAFFVKKNEDNSELKCYALDGVNYKAECSTSEGSLYIRTIGTIVSRGE